MKRNKKKEFARESELTGVPFYRAYGVTKKEGFLAHFNDVLASVIAIAIYLLCVAVVVIGLIVYTTLLGALGVLVWAIIVMLFVYIVLLRRIRSRAKFFRKLRKAAKTYGLKVEKKRGFWRGLRLNKEGFDFTVSSNKKIWYVRFFATPRKRQKLIIESPTTVKIVSNILNSRIKFFLNLNKPRIKTIDYSFDEKPVSLWGQKCAKALVLNPSPFELLYRDKDGAIIPTGTGHQIFDYTVFTGSGFINTISRENEEV